MVETTSLGADKVPQGAEQVPHGLQNIFDFVARKLLEQSSKSLGHGIMAYRFSYRGADGARCAAGHLIPEDAYRPTMEGMLADKVDWFTSRFDTEEMGLIRDLQSVHDGTEPILWHYSLCVVAKRLGLDPYAIMESDPL